MLEFVKYDHTNSPGTFFAACLVPIPLFLTLLFFTSLTSAQKQAPQWPKNNFEAISTQHGLSSSYVNDLIKDKDGFIWFATRNGLNRYDGTDFLVFKYDSGNPLSLTNNDVTALWQDEKGKIWIGTYGGGLNFYEPKTGLFGSFHQKDNSGQNWLFINDIVGDDKGNIYLATEEGLYHFSISTQTFTRISLTRDNPENIDGTSVYSLLLDKHKNLWVGTTNSGLFKYKPNENTVKPYSLGELEDSNGFYKRIFSLFETFEGTILLGTGAGLGKYEEGTDRFSPFYGDHGNLKKITDRAVLTIDEDNFGRLWIGTWLDGLLIVDKNGDQTQQYLNDAQNASSISQNRIRKIFIDGNRYAWLCTYTDGLNLYDFTEDLFPRNVLPKDSESSLLEQSTVSAICKDTDDNLWIGTSEVGLFKINRHKQSMSHYLKEGPREHRLIDNEILALHEDQNELLWIGTSNGLMRYDKSKDQFLDISFYPFFPKGTEIMIRSIAEDNNALWLGTKDQGLLRMDKKTLDVKQFSHHPDDPNSLTANYVRTVYVDSKNRIWVGTKVGLNVLMPNTNRFRRILHDAGNESSLGSNFIESIYEDDEGIIWLGTHGAGLSKLPPDAHGDKFQFINYGIADGLPSDAVNGILPEGSTKLWLSTANGLCRFDKDENLFVHFWQWDGFRSASFVPGAYDVSKDGEILLGTSRGYLTFYPKTIPDIDSPPKILLTNFKIHNEVIKVSDRSVLKKPINETEKIVLRHSQSAFSFNFVALNYSRGQNNKYAYILEGMDEDWNYVGNRNEAIYTNIQPGEYTFKIKAANHHNVWNNTPREIKIIVNPPFWKSPWAYITYVMILGLLVWWYRRMIIAREKLKTDLRLQRQQHEVDKKLHEMDELKIRFFNNISHEIRTPLTLIMGPIRNLIGMQDGPSENGNRYRMIYRSAQRLYQLVNQLMDTSKIESGKMKVKVINDDVIDFLRKTVNEFKDIAEHTGKDLIIKTSPDNFVGWFDEDKLKKITYNLTSNAIKFTPSGGTISASIEIYGQTENKPNLLLKVCDTGVGIPLHEQEKIFEYFHQSTFTELNDTLEDKNFTESWDGTGIGLALTKQLVHLHKGTIELKSEVGKGSCFTIQLPLGGQYYDSSEKIKKSSHNLVDFMQTPLLDEPIESSMDLSPQNPVILIVDDNPDMRKFIRGLLEPECQILEARDGKEGEIIAIENMPDLIITDLMMPETNGIELTKFLKNDFRTSHIPIIMLTAVMKREEQLKGYSSGADDYMTKPFDPQFLKARVAHLIHSRKKLREHFRKEFIIAPRDMSFNSPDEKFLENLLELIEEHISDSDFDIETFSEKMFMSRSQLYRKIRALTDQTPKEFVRALRLKRAAQMLRDSHYTAAEVGYSVGFKTPAHFSRCFKEHFGQTPAQFGKS